MIEAFNAGQDIHASTASKVFGVPLSDVTREQRSSAKNSQLRNYLWDFCIWSIATSGNIKN